MAQTITLDVTEPAKTGSTWTFNGIVTVIDDKNKKPKAGVQLLFYVDGKPHLNSGDIVDTDEQGKAAKTFDLPKGKYRIEAIVANTTSKSPHRTVTLDDTPKAVATLKISRPAKNAAGSLELVIRAADEKGNPVKQAKMQILDPETGTQELTADDAGLAKYTTTVSSPSGRKRIEVFSGAATDWTFIYRK